MKEVPVLMITERALIFQKIRVRFAKNLVLYSIPESPDILDTTIPDIMDTVHWDKIMKSRLALIKAKKSSKDTKMTEE